MENSGIAWTDHTFNPWMGCVKVSAGCANCYAEALVAGRMSHDVWGEDRPRRRTRPANWNQPLKWNRAAEALGRRYRVFCASLCDVFERHDTANAARPDLWSLIRRTPLLDWLLLTKRPENIRGMLPAGWGGGWPNVWLGTSIENNAVVERADYLRENPAVVHFVSYEPALGPLDELPLHGIDWLIYGGESGAGRRPDSERWALDVERRCAEHGTAFFFKQRSAGRPGFGDLDGRLPRAFPEPRRTS